jgi:hypothetical protein
LDSISKIGLVLTYNQEDLICDAIRSLLNQSDQLSRIIVSDDASSDNTIGRILSEFSDEVKSHAILLNRNHENLGFIKHFNHILASYVGDGDLVFYNAGDDVSQCDRVREVSRAYELAGSPKYFLCHSYVEVERQGGTEFLVPPILGIEKHREVQLVASAYHIGASQVFTGTLFRHFGQILFDDCYEDLVLGYRALLLNAYKFIPLPLVKYRLGGLSGWKNNDLERKRSRFQSTLLQRTVDSVHAGDFSSLPILAECYMQYGFCQLAHPEKIDVFSVVENAPARCAYSLADNFSKISNVVKLHNIESVAIADVFRKPSLSNKIIWLSWGRLKQDSLEHILRIRTNSCEAIIVIDLGVTCPGVRENCNNLELSNLDKLMQSFERCFIHCSCPGLAIFASKRYGASRVSYLHPLQDVDGHDPILPSRTESRCRGLVFAVGGGINSLEQFRLAYETLSWPSFGNCLVELDTFDFDGSIEPLGQVGAAPLLFDPLNPKSIMHYDFVVLVAGGRDEHVGALNFLWSLAAKYGVPVFISGAGAAKGIFVHGKSALIVDDTVKNWWVSLEMTCKSKDYLRMIGTQARELLYFEASIQKKVAMVTQLFGKLLGKTSFYDKFLPL